MSGFPLLWALSLKRQTFQTHQKAEGRRPWWQDARLLKERRLSSLKVWAVSDQKLFWETCIKLGAGEQTLASLAVWELEIWPTVLIVQLRTERQSLGSCHSSILLLWAGGQYSETAHACPMSLTATWKDVGWSHWQDQEIILSSFWCSGTCKQNYLFKNSLSHIRSWKSTANSAHWLESCDTWWPDAFPQALVNPWGRAVGRDVCRKDPTCKTTAWPVPRHPSRCTWPLCPQRAICWV